MKSKIQKRYEAEFRDVRQNLISLYTQIFNYHNGHTSFLLSNYPSPLSENQQLHKEQFLSLYNNFCSYPIDMQETGLSYYKYTIGEHLLTYWKTEQKIKFKTEILDETSLIPLKNLAKNKI